MEVKCSASLILHYCKSNLLSSLRQTSRNGNDADLIFRNGINKEIF